MSTFSASIVSLPSPQASQGNRSSEDFKFAGNEGRIRVKIEGDSPDNITCDLTENVSGGPDPDIMSLSNNQLFPGTKVGTGAKYYISDPSGTQSNFVVTFTYGN